MSEATFLASNGDVRMPAICILAGGESKRIGTDKCSLLLGGKRLIDYAIATARKTGLSVLIASGKREYANAQSVKDSKGTGPIAGLYSSLLLYDPVLIIPCDMPFLTAELLAFLAERSEGFDVTLFRIGEKIQPQVGVYSRACLPYIERTIVRKKYSLFEIINEEHLKVNIVDEREIRHFKNFELCFYNINTRGDLARAEEIVETMKSGGPPAE